MRTDSIYLTGIQRLLFISIPFFFAVLVISGTEKTDPSRWDARETADLTKTIEPMVSATLETMSVRAPIEADSADDPAIWKSKSDPSLAVIMGTNKQAGIHVYDLHGKEIQFLETGLVNNMDVRYAFKLDASVIDIAGASNRSHQSIDLFKINPKDGTLSKLTQIQVSAAIDEIYGFCLAKDSETGRFFALANGKNGVIEQWEIEDDKGEIKSTHVRSLKVPSQPEGMVSDDLSRRFFVGEEEAGIWVFDLLPESNRDGMLIPSTSPHNTPSIATDIEGITLYYLNKTDGYLLASSQGNHSYAVFERQPPFPYLGSFSIMDSEKMDGVEETDGIDVINLPLGEAFPTGCFVAQDGYNLNAQGEPVAQNFKLVPWESIAKVLNLEINSDYSGWR